MVAEAVEAGVHALPQGTGAGVVEAVEAVAQVAGEYQEALYQGGADDADDDQGDVEQDVGDRQSC